MTLSSDLAANRYKVILDLCGGTGAWSRPYAEAGYDVRVVTLPDVDVRLMTYGEVAVTGILAAPPCTMFAQAGYRWQRTNAQMLEALSVVDACLRAVVAYTPKWWALENPVGKLVRYLGKPRLYFNPNDYGDPWTKKTCLWGTFTPPTKHPVPATRQCKHNTYEGHCAVGGKSAATMAYRSVTPPAFAHAFFKANP